MQIEVNERQVWMWKYLKEIYKENYCVVTCVGGFKKIKV